ncbi:MAG: ATP-dependent DNA helicase RecG [Fimbriimonadales bacterium]|jgi:ATP-dependent DNA helicase RecG|nr:ATP-dependent DNA helicase RecG [Armatimonadota bacterium]MCX7686515.1 ATP-dependent DNA helicase RecG [Fimbriimonadales bacterium]GIV12511.1 MAG: ATP-dependent DNA helicase RecG [Fimbriimonadales bacterium]CUU37361.1 ATP-dependent DNA helicase RecG [Armatimonadetes bacterium GXS]
MERRASVRLDTEVRFLKGVGDKRAQILAKLELYTLQDLLYHLPRRYEDRSQFRRIAHARPGEAATFAGKLITVDNITPRRGLTLTKAFLDDGSGALELVWYNQPYLKDRLLKLRNRRIVVYGVVKDTGWGLQMETPEWEDLEEDDSMDGLLHTNRIVPIYPLTEGIGQKQMRQILWNAIQYADLVPEILPREVRERVGLMPVADAIRQVHFPDRMDLITPARQRLVFEEFFVMQLGIGIKRQQIAQERGIAMRIDEDRLMEKIRQIVPFELTNAQKRVIREIWDDMRRPHPMNRLLQGDVGSGKTIVAGAAILAAVDNQYQAAIMAPTEILAEQHYMVLHRLFQPLGITVELLVGRLTPRQRAQAYERIASGRGMVAVGTHALIQEGVSFARLGLAIVDEQHRFGVLQRAALRDKGIAPHLLVMTATPIPRTLTLSLYGDLDVSIIDEMPPGRKPVKTYWKFPEDRLKVYEGVRKLVAQGRQAYIICPLIEESEKLQVRAAEDLYEHLRKDVFPDLRVGLLHGRMKPAEKEAVMEAFRAGEIDVLVSTTVIEVGVDVPNAVAMIIEDAERFGLAQLHQLRGRVGRGEHQSYCVLIADPKTDEGKARMEIMTRTNNGFLIAEEDLRIRGPGEIYGTRQSGMPSFRVADLVKDMHLLEVARQEAFRLLERDPDLNLPQHQRLKEAVDRFRHKVVVATVG